MKNKMNQTQTGRTFTVLITETLKRRVTVHEAELKEATAEDAVQTVSDWWHNGQIILEADDFDGVEFTAVEAESES